MRRPLPTALSAFLVLLLVGGLACGRGEAVARDPVEAEAEDLLVDYIRIDTSNPPGNETAAAAFFERIFAREGIPARRVGADPRRQSIVARLESGSDAPAVLLLHHLDVVPADPAEWTVPPFEGRRANGYIWGRGSLDVKSLGIAHLMGFLELHRARVPLARDVVFLGVADEEAGGMRGLHALFEEEPALFENVGFVLNEGGGTETIVDRVTWWGIEIDQKVPLWVRLVARGRPGHGSVPPPGGGAPRKILHAVDAVLAIETPPRVTPTVAAYFASLSRAKAELDIRRKILADPEAFLESPALANLPAGARALLQDTIAVSVLDAGTIVNVIPATARAELDIRLLPGSDHAEFLERVRSAAGENAEVEVLLAGAAAPPSPVETPLFRLIAERCVAASPGSVVGPFVSVGTTDSRYLRARGLVAYGFSPFPVNYYDGARVHAADERIRARFFARGVSLMRQIVRGAATAPEL